MGCCPDPAPQAQDDAEKVLSPRSLLLFLMSSASLAIMFIASRAGCHKADETHHGHQAEEERTESQEGREGPVVHMDGW